MKFHFITLFPETIDVWMRSSILGRAHANRLFDYRLIQLRDFAHDRHRTVDDVSYGGGGGMVLKVEPLVGAIEAVRGEIQRPSMTVAFTAGGDKIDHSLVLGMARNTEVRDFILVCGHYEGFDQRVLDGWIDRELSLGDFVLTGGEIPAVALADAMIRQIEGALGNRLQACREESFSLRDESGLPLIEHPQYTRPPQFRDRSVPPVLLSGDHGKIAEWRKAQSLQRTRRRRPRNAVPTVNKD